MHLTISLAWVAVVGVLYLGSYYMFQAVRLQDRIWRIYATSSAVVQSDIAMAVKAAKQLLVVIGLICISAAIVAVWVLTTSSKDAVVAIALTVVAGGIGRLALFMFEGGDFDKYARYLYAAKPSRRLPDDNVA